MAPLWALIWCLFMGLEQTWGMKWKSNDRSQTFSLNGRWDIRNSHGSYKLKGEVPGCVHTALAEQLLIEDPYVRFNDAVYKWIAQDEWIYSRTFSLPLDIRLWQKVILVFEGIDTVSTILLNNISVAKTYNMFTRYTVDVTKIVAKDNNIEVQFQSAVNWAKDRSGNSTYKVPPDCPPQVQKGECHVNFIRKSQCSFSWDWGPSFPTQGIWKEVRIEAYNAFHLDYLSFVPVFDKISQWTVMFESVFDVITNGPLPGNVTVKIPDLNVDEMQTFVLIPGQQELKMTVKISKKIEVNLWWPNGYGSQNSYNLTVKFLFDGGYTVENTTKIYFRSVELVEEPIQGSLGLSFYMKINQVPIFLKGSNWIPADSFQDKITLNRLHNLLQSVVDANMNTLRVWGGGLYESDEFYRLCDELGIMVWQDFMFACALYPTDKWFLETVEAEVIHQMRRLRSHPSIIVWSGNNENEAAIADNWFSIPAEKEDVYRMDYVTLYIKTIMPLVLKMDETRPFISSSPTNGKESVQEYWLAKNPYDNHYGDIHYYSYITDCWDWKSYPKPRLASEYGFQSWPSLSTLKKVSVPVDWHYTSNFCSHRQHHSSGNEQMLSQAKLHYKNPENNDPIKEFQYTLYLTQVMQAQCVKLQTEFYRRSMREIVGGLGHTMGALYWQLNDIWQAPSWSSIEYGGKWKMLHYYAKNFFTPVAASAFEDKDVLQIYGVSDLTKSLSLQLEVKVYRWNSLLPVCERLTEELIFNVNTSQIYKEPIPELLRRCQNSTRENSVVVFSLLNQGQPYSSMNWHYLTSLKHAQGLLQPNITVSITRENTGFAFHLVTSSVAPFVWLDVWDISGRFSDNGFLLAEKTKTVYFYPWQTTSVDELQRFLNVTTLQDIY
ncbi:hypothetical protein XENTR_v10000933 [Xenopus tropicalis]|uniref:Beta-mannosidase n=1 Tax=Xenopus tropicalis TaxID=8364 RepID=F7EIP0_XENTR|nr:beta-mannosidase [Xenopus tropicalis]KAE8630723.1 hypothetical protein XENTR_v10000933 [Xenopus tropicalis]